MEAVLENIVQVIKRYSIGKIVLFGSRARGDHTPTSDYDIAIFHRGALTSLDRATIYSEIEEIPTLKKIDVVFMHPGDQDELWANVEREGIVAYEQV